MIKILHAADLHLDSAFSSLSPRQAAERRREQRLALGRLKEACADCDLLLLAGDLFDSAHIYRDTLDALKELFGREEVLVEKKTKSGDIQNQNIVTMIRRMDVTAEDANTVRLHGLVCCQNPTLNPMQLVAAIGKYLPELKPDFARCARLEIYDNDETIFR